jgi:hypothetical protein
VQKATENQTILSHEKQSLYAIGIEKTNPEFLHSAAGLTRGHKIRPVVKPGAQICHAEAARKEQLPLGNRSFGNMYHREAS